MENNNGQDGVYTTEADERIGQSRKGEHSGEEQILMRSYCKLEVARDVLTWRPLHWLLTSTPTSHLISASFLYTLQLRNWWLK